MDTLFKYATACTLYLMAMVFQHTEKASIHSISTTADQAFSNGSLDSIAPSKIWEEKCLD